MVTVRKPKLCFSLRLLEPVKLKLLVHPFFQSLFIGDLSMVLKLNPKVWQEKPGRDTSGLVSRDASNKSPFDGTSVHQSTSEDLRL